MPDQVFGHHPDPQPLPFPKTHIVLVLRQASGDSFSMDHGSVGTGVHSRMALGRKNSKPFVYQGRRFRYNVGLGGEEGNGWFTLKVTVQDESGAGAKLVATCKSRDVWLDFPEPHAPEDYITVTGKTVERLIAAALSDGWNPDAPGPVFQMALPED